MKTSISEGFLGLMRQKAIFVPSTNATGFKFSGVKIRR